MSVDDLPEGLRLLLDAVNLLAQRCLDGNDDVNQLAQPFFIPHCTFGQEGPLEGQSQMSTSMQMLAGSVPERWHELR